MRASLARSICCLSLVARGLAVSNSTNSSSITTAYLSDDYLDLGIVSDAYEKAKAFVATLNNTQKISICMAGSFTTDNSSWASYVIADSPAGLNKYFYVSAFPMGNGLTQTWNRDLIAAQYEAVGKEFFATGNSMVDAAVLSPLGRVPEGGRQNEGFSPDPFLSGILAAESVVAQNAVGVISGVRHFIFNEQETNRTGTVYDSIADDKTLHELYMWPFADVVHSGGVAILCAMNLVNGTRSCQNNELLSSKLKTELGFPGMIWPDAEAQDTALGSALAGLDYSQYSVWTQENLMTSISNGSLPQARLDDMATRVVLPYYYVGLDTSNIPTGTATDITTFRDIRANHSTLIRQIGGEAISLLKNNVTNGGGLPLNKPHTISLFGAHAGPPTAGPNYPFSVQGTTADIFEGHLVFGGGSGQTSLPYLITPFQAITQHAVEDGSMIWWIMNNTFSGTSGQGAPGGISLGGGTGVDQTFTDYAENSAVCLVFLNSWSGEGADRSSLYNTEQDDMVNTVASSCNNTVVVINISGPRILDAWIEHENVTAVLYSGLLGQESGNAIADVLYGDVNPSGKLIHTIAKNTSDYPASVCATKICDFTEGVYIDYRWFDANDIEPRYPFGHGLSYTEFTYGTVTATITNTTALSSKYASGTLTLGGKADLFEEVIIVNTTVSNTGSVDGAEVAQLYLSFPEEADQPVRVLRGFEKVSVAVGETAAVSFALRRRDVSYWDVAAQNWAVASGDYVFGVGASSRDIRANATITI